MSSSILSVVNNAQKYMRDTNLDGWLLYDYRGINPILWDILGSISNVTRPCWLWIPAQSDPILLVSYVDKGRFSNVNIPCQEFVSRKEMIQALEDIFISNNVSNIAFACQIDYFKHIKIVAQKRCTFKVVAISIRKPLILLADKCG